MGGGAPVPRFLTELGGPAAPPHFFLGVPLAVADSVPFGKRAHVASSDFKSYGPKLALLGAVYDLGDHYRDPEKRERV